MVVVEVHGYEIDPEEVSRLMFEISVGWGWGDPRSEIAQTPENEAVWNQLKAQIEDTGGSGSKPVRWQWAVTMSNATT